MRDEIAAGGIVFKIEKGKLKNENAMWLICQHSQHKGWVFPKGLVGDVKEDEPLEEAALREVVEEGGVKAKIIANLPKPVAYFYKFQGQLIKKTVYYFLMEYISGDPKDHDHEMTDAKFVSTDEVKNTLSYKSDKQAFEEALRLFHS